MIGGPLTRLRFFGFFCSCYESDEEYTARLALEHFDELQEVTWLCDDAQELYANLRLVDGPVGPTLQLTCRDVRRSNVANRSLWGNFHIETKNKLLVQVPLRQIDRVELLVTNDEELLQVHAHDGRESRLLLEFKPSSGTTKDHLKAILRWDGARRADIETRLEHRYALQQLRDERKQLVREERQPVS
jgi:hypothetical protein